MRPFLLMTSLVLLPWSLPGQADRCDVGLRLRALERELAGAEPGPARAAALRQLEQAVAAFFHLDLGAVAATIETARDALAGREPDAAVRWARSLRLEPTQRLVDAAADALPCALVAAYDPGVAAPDAVRLRLWLGTDATAGDAAPDGATAVAVTSPPTPVALPVRGTPPGDHVLHWQVLHRDELLLQRRIGLSVVADRDARLRALAAAVDRGERIGLEADSLRGLQRMLLGMTRRRAEETILPGARLLAEAEQVAAALARDERFYGPDRPGGFWLRPRDGRGDAVPLRLLVPAASGDPQPLVLALHGAGGSENLFFDSYGDGLAADLCARRGWYLAAPRAGLGTPDLAGLVDALLQRYPVDPRRVFVVGHSMGAAMAVAATTPRPDRFAGVAALGGGGAVSRNAALAPLPFLVLAGERDFGRSGAASLRRQLEAAGAGVVWRVLPEVEHWSVVQFGLPEVFGWFDRLAGR